MIVDDPTSAWRSFPVTEWFRLANVWKWLNFELTRYDRPRIWVGACATGQEAYSAAILAAVHDGTVLASDVSPELIELARAARYPKREIMERLKELGMLNGLGGRLLAALSPVPGSDLVTISDEIAARVTFEVRDLNTADVPECDVAILTNVWRHLSPSTPPRLAQALHDVLAPRDGRLFIGTADIHSTIRHLIESSDSGIATQHLERHFERVIDLPVEIGREFDLVWKPRSETGDARLARPEPTGRGAGGPRRKRRHSLLTQSPEVLSVRFPDPNEKEKRDERD